MTPQEVTDYKLKWYPGHEVFVHSDLDVKAKDWCRKHFERQHWSMDKFTDVYEHTFRFERQTQATKFKEEFVDANCTFKSV